MTDDHTDQDSHDSTDDDQDGGGLASLVNQSLNSAPEHPRPSHRDVPLSVTRPGYLVVLSVIVIVVGILIDDSETLSDLSAVGGFAFVLLPFLFLIFLPWLGIALFTYSRRLESGRRQTTMKFVGIAALVVAAIPWIPAAIVVIVSPFWSP